MTLLTLFAFFLIATAESDFQVALVLPKLTKNEGSWLSGLRRSFTTTEAHLEMLNTSRFELAVVEDDACSYSYKKETAIADFLNKTVYQANSWTTIAVVGLFCPQTARLFTGLFGRDRGRNFPFPLFSVLPSLKQQETGFFNIFHVTNSLEIFGQSLESFLLHLQWLRVSILTGSEKSIHTLVAERIATLITAQHHITVTSYIQAERNMNFTRGGFDARVVLMVMEEEEATRLLCDAHQHGMRWPRYAWIFLSIYGQKLNTLGNKCLFHGQMTPEVNLTGVFLITYGGHRKYSNSTGPFACNSEAYLAGLTCDCINLALLAHNHCQGNCSFMKYIGTIKTLPYVSYHAGELKYNKTLNSLFAGGVTVIQLVGNKSKAVAHYNSSLFLLDNTIRENSIPPTRVYRPPFIFSVVLYLLDTITVFTLLTATFILYIIYRKEPEVKASSFTVTILCYFANYTIIFYLFLITLTELFVLPKLMRNVICIARSWLNVLSCQGPLITATTLVKVFRVYRIFHPVKLSRGGRCLSNQVLILIVLILQVPNTVINLVWTITDTYLSSAMENAHTNYIEIRFKCHSKDIQIWTFLLMAYNTILCLILVFIAVKTRKIRRKNFKDTKKVNVFIFTYLFIVSIVLPLFLLGYAVSNIQLSEAVLHVGSSVLIVASTLFLFVPKVYPPLKRTLIGYRLVSSMRSKISVSLHSIASQYTSFTNLPKL